MKQWPCCFWTVTKAVLTIDQDHLCYSGKRKRLASSESGVLRVRWVSVSGRQGVRPLEAVRSGGAGAGRL